MSTGERYSDRSDAAVSPRSSFPFEMVFSGTAATASGLSFNSGYCARLRRFFLGSFRSWLQCGYLWLFFCASAIFGAAGVTLAWTMSFEALGVSGGVLAGGWISLLLSLRALESATPDRIPSDCMYKSGKKDEGSQYRKSADARLMRICLRWPEVFTIATRGRLLHKK